MGGCHDDPAFSGEPDGVAREGKGEARPSFYKAMNALRDDVIDICLLDPNGWDDAEITGVTLKYLEGDIGVVITAQNKNEELASPININTPYLVASPKLKVKLEPIQEEARDIWLESVPRPRYLTPTRLMYVKKYLPNWCLASKP